jgi:hypothetical protein
MIDSQLVEDVVQLSVHLHKKADEIEEVLVRADVYGRCGAGAGTNASRTTRSTFSRVPSMTG